MTGKPSAGKDTSELQWYRSSYSGSDNNDCVEVAAFRGTVHVRDSKNVPGPQVSLTAAAWADFVAYAASR
ncbi:DUF397 domain-containing protein [Streptomyces sp. JJ36]|uniref:DUF397 domain-containing protein n=1 Tax=Streptomyces sp. JJ36 TaxID=2736645 RepID=UPI001F1FC147|nr:DUF397 domain-containing protein [Streptomyces sp. JJ36]MCF6521595.1 DUF397 domain-containing protein [Streptomyces sp. JJ36]